MAKKCTPAQADARGRDCTLRIPGVCNFDPSTTVLAHVGRHGSAKRNHDEEAVFACSACHDAIDYRNKYFLSDRDDEQRLLRKDRAWFIARALEWMRR